jgi:Flp pilus assembly protein TadG
MLAWWRWRSLLARFRADERGIVLMLVVLLLVPLMLVMAGVIDYSRTFLVKRHLTNAVDSAALALGVLPGLSDEEAKQKAEAFINTHYPVDEIGELTVVQVTRDGEQIDVTATARVDMTFLRLADIDTIDVTVDARAIRKENKLDVALVLDNTGSMSHSNKIQDLRAAARSFVDILFAEDDADKFVKVGLVPFTAAVRLDNPPSTWLDELGQSSIHAENLDLGGDTLFDLYANIGETWNGCLRARPEPYDTTDEPPSTGNPDTLWVPFFAPDEPDSGGYSNNYLVDDPRDELPDDMSAQAIQRDITKYTSPSWQFKPRGPDDLCPARPILGLTNDPNILREQIDLLNAAGNTVIPAGLAWGWRLISPREPFTQGAPYSDQKTIKAVILLTDGENVVSQGGNGHNESRFSAYGYAGQPVAPSTTEGHLGPIDGSQAHATLDAKTAQLCENIKADKDDDPTDQDILVFTITFKVPSQNIKTLMRDCATDVNKHFDSDDDLTKVFEQIAIGLNQLRLAE